MEDHGERMEEAQARVSRLAAAAFACGLLCFIPPCAVAALVLGRKALKQVDDSGGGLAGRRMAQAAVSLGGWACAILLPLIACMIILPAFSHGGSRVIRSCRSNLKQIGLTISMYQHDFSDAMPPDLQTLAALGYCRRVWHEDWDVFICPQAEELHASSSSAPDADLCGDYVYAGYKTSLGFSPAVPIAWDRYWHSHRAFCGRTTRAQGAFVLYADYHAEWKPKQEVLALIARNAALYEAAPQTPLLLARPWSLIEYISAPAALVIIVVTIAVVARKRHAIRRYLAQFVAPWATHGE